jgi:UDP-N-acetylmuramoylalanine--D-glutamate ligase
MIAVAQDRLKITQVRRAVQNRHNSNGAFSALIVGLGREGTALARFLATRGARVIVTDTQPASALSENVVSLSDLTVSYALGGHPLSLLEDVDVVFVSPGVPLEIPLLLEARRRNLPLSSETRLFSRLCPAPVVGITGSSGKTTTTALVGEMLKCAGRRTWVGGNIGQPLIGHLDDIAPTDVVVIELSSFQLEFFAPFSLGVQDTRLPFPSEYFDSSGWSPPVAAILNITPNHLDRHATMDAYIAAKSHILSHQERGDIAVLSWDNPITRGIGDSLRADRRLLWFSTHQEVPEGAFLRDDELVVRLGAQESLVCQTRELGLLGRHNVENALAACALARATRAPIQALRQAATTFTGVEHRLELVRERNDVKWYDDSIATTPERTVAALQTFPEGSIVLLAGGRDKHLPWEDMAGMTRRRVHHLVLFGEAAGLIEEAVRGSEQSGPEICQVRNAGTLERAVEIADSVAQPGDVVLLSPGGTSFDAYRDFAERGDHFRQLVDALE